MTSFEFSEVYYILYHKAVITSFLKIKFVLTMIVVLCVVLNLNADVTATALSFSKTPPETKTRTIGTKIYDYEVSYYNPAARINLFNKRVDARYDTPEAAVISLFSSIVTKDIDWWFESFDQNRQRELLEQKKAEYDEVKNILLQEWADSYKDKSIELFAHIKYKDYILIDCIIYNPNGSKASRELNITKFENGMWKITVDKGPAAFYLFKWD